VLALVLAACGQPVATPEPVFLEAAGAMAMAPLVEDLSAAYHQRSPTVKIGVENPGTWFGLQSLAAGEIDLALAAWLSEPPGPGYKATAIARDGLAMVVHPSNPLDGLGLLQLQELFSGRAIHWTAVGGSPAQGTVQLISREEGSGSREAFEALVMVDVEVSPLAIVAPSSQAVLTYVAGQPDAIGYVSMSEVSSAVKVLAVEGVLPGTQNTSDGSYALTHELWLVTREPSPAAVEGFVEFALSPAGQQIVGRQFGRIR
jgi:phosphate transport system substrate-binding protein